MKHKICVVMGGPSAEHDISLQSGRQVLTHIDRELYDARAVVINRKGDFFFCDTDAQTVPSPDELATPEKAPRMKGPFRGYDASDVWDGSKAAFLAVHGSFGEDGVLQGYLETLGLPYTGSDVYASAVAMNKITSKYLYLNNGLSVPPYSVYGGLFPQNTPENIAERHGFPCFVKCPQSGSSKLMGRVSTLEELTSILEKLRPFSPEILVETSLQGIEFTCGVLEKDEGRPFALPPVEIRPRASYFDFTAKYTAGASEELVPAPRPPELLRRIQETALAAHRLLGCAGISRTDMILESDTLYVLETNTLPGLTSNSLIPKSYAAVGGTFAGLIDLLLRHALSRAKRAVS